MSVDVVARGLAAKAKSLAEAAGGGGGSAYTEVATYNDLPSAALHPAEIYVVQTTTGIIGFRKLAGLWRSDGANWNYLGLYGRNASEIVNVPAGSIAATDVQAAINEIDGDVTSHVGSGGGAHSAATAGTAGFMSAADKSKLDGVAAGATANSTDADLRSRSTHTGTQSIATIVAAATARIFGRTSAGGGAGEELTPTQVRAMINVADGATANASDTFLRDRANHTGSQAASTISDFNTAADARAAAAIATHEAASNPHPIYLTQTEGDALYAAIASLTESIDDRVAALLTSGSNITLTYDDVAGTLTIAAAGGGSGSPGGTTGQVQFNNAGAFGGAANVLVDGGNLKLLSTTDPAAPAGGIILYSKNVAGRHLPKIIGPSGIDTILQVGLSGNSVFMVAPASGTTAPTAWGGTLTTATTMSFQQTIASANPWQATARKRFASAATAGSVTGMRTAYAQWFRGNAAGFGGFFFRTQIGQNLNVNGAQVFHGLCASTGALATTAGAVSALLNCIGMGYDTTDLNTGNWQLFRNDGTGTCTKVDLGANAARNTTHGYDLIIYCPPGAATEIFVRIVNIHTGVVVLDTSYNTDIPAVNVGMAYKGEGNNGAVASAMNLEVAKVYIESDY